METVNGRTCCEARQEFLRLVELIARSKTDYDRLFVETTGVAHPGMIAHAILGDPFLREHLELDGIVTVVDAKHILEHLGREGHADEQIAYADLLLINKIDLVSPVELRWVKDALNAINADCERIHTQDAMVSAARVLNIGGFDLKRVEQGIRGCSKNESPALGHKHHQHEITTVSLEIEGKLDASRFSKWMQSFSVKGGGEVFRAKGSLAISNVPERMVFQFVHGIFRLTLGQPWRNDEPLVSQLVLIGRNLQSKEIRLEFEGCRA